MTTAVRNVLDQARQLSAEERADVLDMLLVEAEHFPDPEVEKAWIEEIERRVASIENGEARLIDGDEVMKALRRGECP